MEMTFKNIYICEVFDLEQRGYDIIAVMAITSWQHVYTFNGNLHLQTWNNFPDEER